jgi:hypothetical protein
MNLFYYAQLPEVRRVTADDHKIFRQMAWNPQELIQLKLMKHRELMGLMMFCGIRVYNEMPVIACEDNELRMAYLVWRGAMSTIKRNEIVRLLERLKRNANRAHEGILFWLQEMM